MGKSKRKLPEPLPAMTNGNLSLALLDKLHEEWWDMDNPHHMYLVGCIKELSPNGEPITLRDLYDLMKSMMDFCETVKMSIDEISTELQSTKKPKNERTNENKSIPPRRKS